MGADGIMRTVTTHQRTPLSADEMARGEANFAPIVAQMLVTRGLFRVSADTSDQVELWQAVARRAGITLQRPVDSYSNGREIVITFRQENGLAPGIGHAPLPSDNTPQCGELSSRFRLRRLWPAELRFGSDWVNFVSFVLLTHCAVSAWVVEAVRNGRGSIAPRCATRG